jgi:hypothetical protein
MLDIIRYQKAHAGMSDRAELHQPSALMALPLQTQRVHQHTAVASQQTLSAAQLLGCAAFENSARLLITRAVQPQVC